MLPSRKRKAAITSSAVLPNNSANYDAIRGSREDSKVSRPREGNPRTNPNNPAQNRDMTMRDANSREQPYKMARTTSGRQDTPSTASRPYRLPALPSDSPLPNGEHLW